jgi:hypothetical protein
MSAKLGGRMITRTMKEKEKQKPKLKAQQRCRPSYSPPCSTLAIVDPADSVDITTDILAHFQVNPKLVSVRLADPFTPFPLFGYILN